MKLHNWGIALTCVAFLGLTACSNNSGNSGTGTGTTGSSNVGNNNGGTTTNPTPMAKNYVVQLTATENSAKAARLKRTFVDEGYENVMISTISNGTTKIHRVQIGPYATETEGNNMLIKLKRRYKKNQYINNAVVKTIYGK